MNLFTAIKLKLNRHTLKHAYNRLNRLNADCAKIPEAHAEAIRDAHSKCSQAIVDANAELERQLKHIPLHYAALKCQIELTRETLRQDIAQWEEEGKKLELATIDPTTAQVVEG